MNFQVQSQFIPLSSAVSLRHRWEHQVSEVLLGLADLDSHSSREHVHRLRVLSRRIRATFRSLAPYLGKKDQRKLRKQLKLLTQGLGAVRSWEVSQQHLEVFRDVAFLEKVFRARVRRLRSRWDRPNTLNKVQKKIKLYTGAKTLVQAMELLDQSGLKEQLLFQGQSLQSKIEKNWKEFCSRGKIKDFHQTRIAVKKWRYHLEILSNCFACDCQHELAYLKGLQDRLGNLNDWVVLREHLQDPWVKQQLNKKKQRRRLKEIKYELRTRIDDELVKLRKARNVLLTPLATWGEV